MDAPIDAVINNAILPQRALALNVLIRNAQQNGRRRRLRAEHMGRQRRARFEEYIRWQRQAFIALFLTLVIREQNNPAPRRMWVKRRLHIF